MFRHAHSQSVFQRIKPVVGRLLGVYFVQFTAVLSNRKWEAIEIKQCELRQHDRYESVLVTGALTKI